MQAEICNRQTSVDVAEEDVLRVLRLGLELEARDAELSVAVVDDGEIQALNRRFLGRDEVTDVLAFVYETMGDTVNGEIVVNAELALREADARPHGAREELMLYLVHGLLHLLGYDDHADDERDRMRDREQEILRAAGYAVVF